MKIDITDKKKKSIFFVILGIEDSRITQYKIISIFFFLPELLLFISFYLLGMTFFDNN